MSGGRVDHKQTPSSLPRHKEFWVGSMAGANCLHSRVYGSIPNIILCTLKGPNKHVVDNKPLDLSLSWPNPCQAPWLTTWLTPWLTIVWCGQTMSSNFFQCIPDSSLDDFITHFSWISLWNPQQLWMDDPTRVGQFSSRSTDLFQVKILFVVWGLLVRFPNPQEGQGTWLEVSLRSKLRKDQAGWEDWRAETGQ